MFLLYQPAFNKSIDYTSTDGGGGGGSKSGPNSANEDEEVTSHEHFVTSNEKPSCLCLCLSQTCCNVGNLETKNNQGEGLSCVK